MKTVAEKIGLQVSDLLYLKFNKKDNLTKTSWGTKTVVGIGECITRIVEEENERAFKKIGFYSAAAEGKWDDVEVHPVIEDDNGNCDVCDRDEDATYFSVYLHQVEGGVQCIADLPTRELAEQLAELINIASKTYSK